MRVTPFHRENYSRLILGVIIQFYQRCFDRFQSIASHETSQEPPGMGEPPRLILPAVWAQLSDMATCLGALRTSSVSCLLEWKLFG